MAETTPSVLETATAAHEALLAARTDGHMPEDIVVITCAIEPDTVTVSIGGLTDEHLFGPGGGTDESPESIRFRDTVSALMRRHMPRKDSGELWHRYRVVLLPEDVWRAPYCPPEGVIHHPLRAKAGQ
ncbi:hypothetical protein [Alloactinosynnema sp. L-07]|uniref:hypothetical protein n=1 Tax=Alloactinosynnema sp. L-07 TaxID=1653480 RepID=UPI00065EFFC7|nr:hypothetical protein [Alloactinosynnema sp. L-07]CRK55453.1 hypothetical protein [Alloactinosynnema sp. L-07]